MLCWCCSLHGTILFFFLFGSTGGKDAIVFFWTVDSSIVFVVQVQILGLEGTALLVVIFGDMTICIAPFAAAWARARIGARGRRRPWQGGTPFSGQSDRAQRRGMVVVHDLFLLFWSDHVCGHLFSHRTFSWSPFLCNKGGCWVNHLNDDCRVGVHLDCISCFSGGWVLGTTMPVVQTTAAMTGRWTIFFSHGCFFYLSLSRTPATLSAVWHCLIKAMSQRGSMETILFVSASLNWCTLGCARKISSAFSCTVGNSIIQWRSPLLW